MSRSQRRFPRLPTEQPGELEVRATDKGRQRIVTVQVSVRSLAPEGAGLKLHDQRCLPLERGAPLKLRFHIAGQRYELPGSVAWSENRTDDPTRRMDIGIRLHLAMARVQARQAYASWIVNQLNAAQVSARR